MAKLKSEFDKFEGLLKKLMSVPVKPKSSEKKPVKKKGK